MLSDYTVNIVYKNKDLETVRVQEYSLDEYCNDLRNDVLSILGDVEKMSMNTGKSSELFKTIRHKILDSANNIKRLPQNTCYKKQYISSVPISNLIAEAVSERGDLNGDTLHG